MNYLAEQLIDMNRSKRRHLTKKWKIKRKDHHGDKCHLAKCGICSWHKRLGNSKQRYNKQKLIELSK